MRLLFIIACTLFCFANVHAATYEIKIRPAGETLIATQPGLIITYAANISNESDIQRELVLQTTLPEGWVLITKEYPFILDKGSQDLHLVSFLVPQGALADDYNVPCTVRDTSHPAISDTYTFKVKVLPVTKLSFKNLKAPRYIIAGEDYTVTTDVLNESNVPQKVHLGVNSAQSLAYSVDHTDFTLEAGKMQRVAVKVTTDKKLTETLLHVLRLTIQVPGRDDTLLETSSSVEVIPRITGEQKRFHTLPVEITTRYVSNTKGDKHESTYEAQISGNGTIDEAGTKHVDFLLRGPDLYRHAKIDTSTYRLRDEYRMRYWTDEYELLLGDHSYSLTPLVESSLYGRGAGAKFNLGQTKFGGYRMKTRWYEAEESQSAFFTKYSFNDSLTVGLNHLRKETKYESGNITSLLTQLRPVKTVFMELEYAQGNKSGNEDDGYHFDVSGTLKDTSYMLNFIHAEPDFLGSYRDAQYITSGVSFPLEKDLRLNLSFRQEKTNLDLDESKSVAPLDRTYITGISYDIEKRSNLALDLRVRQYRDLLPEKNFDYVENTARISYSKGIEKLNVYSSAQAGTERNRLEGTDKKVQRYSLSAHLGPIKDQVFTGYLYLDKNHPEEGDLQTSLTTGCSASLRLGPDTTLDLSHEKQNYRKSSLGIQRLSEIQLVHTLFQKHKITFLARRLAYHKSSQIDENAWMLEYSIPFNFPVSKSSNYGALQGSLMDVETNTGIAGAVVRLSGISTVTDKHGSFICRGIAPGEYFLDIDSASVGLDKIPASKTPIKVKIQGGEISNINLGICRTAVVSGRVVSYRMKDGSTRALDSNIIMNSNENSPMVESAGLSGIIVELKNADEDICRITDAQGNFSFEELRPGTWTMIIDKSRLPAGYEVQGGDRKVVVAPGQIVKEHIPVVPVKRVIQIVEEREIEVEAPVSTSSMAATAGREPVDSSSGQKNKQPVSSHKQPRAVSMYKQPATPAAEPEKKTTPERQNTPQEEPEQPDPELRMPAVISGPSSVEPRPEDGITVEKGLAAGLVIFFLLLVIVHRFFRNKRKVN